MQQGTTHTRNHKGSSRCVRASAKPAPPAAHVLYYELIQSKLHAPGAYAQSPAQELDQRRCDTPPTLPSPRPHVQQQRRTFAECKEKTSVAVSSVNTPVADRMGTRS